MNLRILTFALIIACDAAKDGITTSDGSTGTPDMQVCPALCDGTCPPECVPDACMTVGDWCALSLGDQQCGWRMACRPLPGSGSKSGVCVAPCSADEPCANGKCNEEAGVCMDDGKPVAPMQCS